jgi:hypothetical protein
MRFARQLKQAAVLDLQDPRSSGPRCRVLRDDCKPFAPIKPCTAGLEPIDASELASFVPQASGERISVRGVLGLDAPSSTFAACHQVAPGITDCCNMASSEVFVGGIANGVRLDRFTCYGDDSRLCCPVPAFGQVVVATGRIMKETDPFLLASGDRLWLADATLCTEARPAGHAGASSAHP